MGSVLVVATSKLTRGGITSVVKIHASARYWDEFKCVWIESHIDGSFVEKLHYFSSGLRKFLVLLSNAQLVHVHFSEPPSALRKLVFISLSKLVALRLIVHFHSFSPETTVKGPFWFIYRIIFDCSDKAIVLSKYWKEVVVDFDVNPGKVAVLLNPCAPRKEFKCESKENYILFAGSICPRKGYKDLIAAFSKIAFDFDGWSLVIAGNGEIEEGKSLANCLGIAERVRFPGWISGVEKDVVFSKAKIFCLPSYAEGFPMAVLDAANHGIPMVTTPIGGLTDYLIDGVNALLFNPGDISTLSEHLRRLVSNERERDRLSLESRKLARDVFGLERIGERISKIYRSLWEKNPNIREI